jgi:hypothetical protein
VKHRAGKTVIAWVRDARWFSAERARGYFLTFLVLEVLFAAGMVGAFMRDSAGPGHGKPVGNDFVAFWSAAYLADQGQPAAGYDEAASRAVEHQFAWMGEDFNSRLPYWYPPVFLLLSLPLGLIGYLPALLLFQASAYSALYAFVRRILPNGLGRLAVIASPALMMNAFIGQNGGFTVSCFAGAMV